MADDDDAMPPPLMGGLMRQATQTDAHGGAPPAASAADDDAMPPPLMGSLMRQATETNPHNSAAPHHLQHSDGKSDAFGGDVPPPQLTLLKHPTIADAHGQISLLSPASRQSSGVVTHTPAPTPSAAAGAGADSKAGDPVFSARHMHSMSRVGAPVPSPSGRHVVFTVKQLRDTSAEWYHEDTNSAFSTALWIADITPAFLSGKQLHAAPTAAAGGAVDAKSAAATPAALPYDGHVRRLTNPPEKKSDFEPVWLDDQTVAFLSTRAGVGSQLWCIAIAGGEAQQLSQFPVAIEHVKYNGVRSFVTFAAEVYTDSKGDGKAVLADAAKRDADKAKRPANFLKYEKLFVRRWDRFVDHAKRVHIFAQPLHKSSAHGTWQLSASGPIDVMSGVDGDCPLPPFGDAGQYAISPFGDELAYATHTVTTSEVAWSTAVKVFTVKLEVHTVNAPKPAAAAAASAAAGPNIPGSSSAGVRIPLPTVTLTAGAATNVSALAPGATAGNDHSPAYSPDGKSLVYMSMKRPQFESDRNRLMCYNRATKQTVELCANWQLSPSAFVWSHDSMQLVLTAEQKAHSAVWVVAAKAGAEPLAIVSKAWNYNVSVLGSAHVVFSRDSFAAPAELFACRLDGSHCTKLTAFNDHKLAALPHALPAAEEFYFAGANKDQVQAWLFRPVGFNAAQKYPVACVIHGGPQGAVGDHWHYRWNPHPLTAAGFAVVIINFHGSTGFGQAFTDSISGDWGGKPFDDLMLGMDHALKAHVWLDGTRQVALGASYGGFMINWVNGNSRRFRCLVNHDGVFNQTAMYHTTEELYFCEFEFRGLPGAPQALYDKFSPHHLVDKMQTPTLVIHGGKDFRVPETEGFATFTALQRRGVPSELLYFPDENHWVLKPANSIVWHSEVIAWLKRWTK